METTALGAAYLKEFQIGLYQATKEITEINQFEKQLTPNMKPQLRTNLLNDWASSIQSTLEQKS